jgi:hypothetical protein
MATTGRKESTSLAHTGITVTTGRKGIRGGNMARAFELRFRDDKSDMKN